MVDSGEKNADRKVGWYASRTGDFHSGNYHFIVAEHTVCGYLPKGALVAAPDRKRGIIWKHLRCKACLRLIEIAKRME